MLAMNGWVRVAPEMNLGVYDVCTRRTGRTLPCHSTNMILLGNPLRYVPTHTIQGLDQGLRAAGIQKYALGRKLEFHGCRVTYVDVEKIAKIFLPDEEHAIYMHQKAVGIYEKAATPTDNTEWRLLRMNGGGGNRTRVRRSLAEGLYMRSRCFRVRPALPPSAGA